MCSAEKNVTLRLTVPPRLGVLQSTKRLKKHNQPFAVALGNNFNTIDEQTEKPSVVNSVVTKTQEVLEPDKLCLKYSLSSIINPISSLGRSDNIENLHPLPKDTPKTKFVLKASEIRAVLARVYDDIRAIDNSTMNGSCSAVEVEETAAVSLSKDHEKSVEEETTVVDEKSAVEVNMPLECAPLSRDKKSGTKDVNLQRQIKSLLSIGRLPPGYTEGTDGVAVGAATIMAGARNGRPLKLGNLSNDALNEARKMAVDAIKKNKVFAILGPYKHIRAGLRKRGWVEKFYRANLDCAGELKLASRQRAQTVPRIGGSLDDNEDIDENYEDCPFDDEYLNNPKKVECRIHSMLSVGTNNLETLASCFTKHKEFPWEQENGYYGLMGRFIRGVNPNFIWSLKKSHIEFKNLRKDQIVNHHPKSSFTTKIGLCRNLRQMKWFEGKSCDHTFPRCFILTPEEGRKAFVDEFRLTAAMGMVKWVCRYFGETEEREPGEKENQMFAFSRFQKVYQKDTDSQQMTLEKAISMSIKTCETFLKLVQNDDIDESSTDNKDVSSLNHQWDSFLKCFYKTYNTISPIEKTDSNYQKCINLCGKLKAVLPQFDLDGQRNIWIVKPGAKSRGRGITCQNKLDSILALISTNISALMDAKFVVQKYIEKPMLIYRTKFDIRQWFIVTDWQPLTIWWYNECYIRFCSKEFSLDTFSEAVHLSNNAISHKYQAGTRNPSLPAENMWYIKEFKQYLAQIGLENKWEMSVLPAMKREIINSMLCSQESIEVRKNSFELYGADFMITADDIKPWLIEINASPCMAPSTSVTMNLTANVLEDTLKVVLDRQTNPRCDTGNFQLIYRQDSQIIRHYNGVELRVSGKKISNDSASGVSLRARSSTPTPHCLSPRQLSSSSSSSSVRPKTPILIAQGDLALFAVNRISNTAEAEIQMNRMEQVSKLLIEKTVTRPGSEMLTRGSTKGNQNVRLNLKSTTSPNLRKNSKLLISENGNTKPVLYCPDTTEKHKSDVEISSRKTTKTVVEVNSTKVVKPEGKRKKSSVLGLLRQRSSSEVIPSANLDRLGIFASVNTSSNLSSFTPVVKTTASLYNSFSSYNRLMCGPQLASVVANKSMKSFLGFQQGSRYNSSYPKIQVPRNNSFQQRHAARKPAETQ